MLRPTILALLAAPLFALPASGQAMAAVCKDGTSSATTGRGACSGHGGVDSKATKKAAKELKSEQKAAVKTAEKAGAMVTCGDGSESKAGRGACARHGGVKVAGMTAPAAAPVPAARPAAVRPTQVAPAPTRTVPTPAASAPARVPTPVASAPVRPAPAAASTSRSNANDPTGATAQCKDGTYSHATTHRGACSRHSGVAKWL